MWEFAGPIYMSISPALRKFVSLPSILRFKITDHCCRRFAPLEPHAVTRETIPIGMGHEFSGTVLEVGPDVPNAETFKKGQKCAIQPTIYCQSCGACRNGVENACANGGFIGLSGKLCGEHC